MIVRAIPPLPVYRTSNPLSLQDEFPDFISLTLLLGLDVFPSQHGPADRAADVADGVVACDELPRDRLFLIGIGKGAGMRMEGCVGWLALNEIGASVAAGEAFADDLRGEAEVGATFTAVEVGGVAEEEFPFGWEDWGCFEI